MGARKRKDKALQEFQRIARGPARKLFAEFTDTWTITHPLEKIAHLSKDRIDKALQDCSDPDASEEKKNEAIAIITSAYLATGPMLPGRNRAFPAEIFDWIDSLCKEVVEAELKKYRGRQRVSIDSPKTVDEALWKIAKALKPPDELFVREVAKKLQTPEREIWRALIKAGLAKREKGRATLSFHRRRASGISDVLVSYLTRYSLSSLRSIRKKNINRDN